jgi:hypothetical protein
MQSAMKADRIMIRREGIHGGAGLQPLQQKILTLRVSRAPGCRLGADADARHLPYLTPALQFFFDGGQRFFQV